MKELTASAYSSQFSDPVPEKLRIRLTESKDLKLPERPERGHKYDVGRALIIAGSLGYSGAPVLAANACERMGAGLTQLIVPRSIYSIAAEKCDGVVVTPAADDSVGFAPGALNTVLDALQKADACLIGPGIGRGDGAKSLVMRILREAKCPLILDADALTHAGLYPRLLDMCPAPLLLTPHEREFERLGGSLAEGRAAGARAFTAAHEKTILVLKGYGTLVCSRKQLFVNPTGSNALAKGGTGDVLAGMLCALLAQGAEPTMAARCAVYLHGLAGDLCAEKLTAYGVAPSDLLRVLPQAIKTIL